MAEYKLFAIKDTKIGFMNPFLNHSKNTAIREFTNGANDTVKNVINTNPEDKELWYLGTYDDQTGAIYSNPEFVIKANDVINKKGE